MSAPALENNGMSVADTSGVVGGPHIAISRARRHRIGDAKEMNAKPSQYVMYRFDVQEVVALVLGAILSFIVSNFLYRLYGSPCVVMHCASLFNYSYMPINRYSLELKTFGFDSNAVDFYMVSIWLSTLFFIAYFLALGVYRSRALLPSIRHQLRSRSRFIWKGIFLTGLSALCILAAVWGITHFEDRLSIFTLSIRLPIIYSLIVIEILSFGVAFCGGLGFFFLCLLFMSARDQWPTEKTMQGENNG
ncbi:hypothetical protein SAMN05519103_02195 [Rhizobiales bacterium GAS113]|nr:hypothetical protein SAMN05519103_02195 [Rhizobiales bacterium GAS113]SEB90365.1 hypothetical protein SAMN05519104_0354 [Rhizobiales bacterium GAS188]